MATKTTTKPAAKAKLADVKATVTKGAKAAYTKGTAAFGDVKELTKGNVEAAMESGKILAEGVQGLGTELVAEGRYGSMVAWQDRGVVEVPMSMVTVGARAVSPDDPLIQTARGLGVYVGEV